MREKLWAECAITTTLLDRILSNKVGQKCRWKSFKKKHQDFADKLRTFGQVGVA